MRSVRAGGGSGDNNTAVGAASLSNGQAANNNTAIGFGTLTQSTGTDNTALGYNSGSVITTGTQNTFLGSTAAAQNGSESINNATAIGYGAVVNSSNTIQLGNTSVINVNTSGNLTAAGYKIPSGTSSQYLMADGSVSIGTAPVREEADEFSAIASQTSFTLTQAPSVNSKVRMYVNGIRISNSAYSWTGTTLTYIPANNGSYSLSLNDRIQFDYFY